MNRDQLNNHVRMEAEELPIGESRKSRCPVCDGGMTREVSFSVTRDQSGILYNCYRAKCSTAGFVPTAGQLIPASRKTPKTRPYHYPVLPLEVCDEEYFYQRFEIANTEHIFRSERDEYILPILDARGLTRGYTVRQPVWSGSPQAPRGGTTFSTVPKARCFPHVPEPMQSFYFPGSGLYRRQQTLVAVEDQVSAIKVAQEGFTAVALCGTTVNMDKIREWSTLSPAQVLIALDADATGEAFKIARRWGLAFPVVRVVMLERDLKDELSSDIAHVLGVE